MSCRVCGSFAINDHHHGREPGVDLDLCDVDYWRTRAEQRERVIQSMHQHYNPGAEPFEGFVIDDDGTELDAVNSLDRMIMDYAKARSGQAAEFVVVPPSLRAA